MRSSVSYQTPNYSAFYRLVLPSKTKSYIAFVCNFVRRDGEGYYTNGMLGSGNWSYEGDFKFIRTEIGISKIINSGKRKNLFFAIGLNYGMAIYMQGTNKQRPTGQIKVNDISVYKVVYNDCLSGNLEIYHSFKLSPRNFVLVGFRERIETPDYYGARLNFTSALYLAYNINGVLNKN